MYPLKVVTMNEENNQQITQDQQNTGEENKDRTSEQFEKLKKSNQELKEERDQLDAENKEYQSVLDSLIPDPQNIPSTPQPPVAQMPNAQNFQNLTQEQVDNTAKSLIDENGYLDGAKLMLTLDQMDKNVKEAQQKAQLAEEKLRQRDQQDQEARKNAATQQLHAEFPMLDPDNEQFNPDFWDAVRNDLIGQMMQGRENPQEAASKWYSRFYGDGDDMKKKEQQKKTANDMKLMNANRPRSSMNVGYYENQEESHIMQQVRAGKKGAVAEMLRRRGQ